MTLAATLIQDIHKLRKTEEINDYTHDMLNYEWCHLIPNTKPLLYEKFRGPIKGLTLQIFTQTKCMPLGKWCETIRK